MWWNWCMLRIWWIKFCCTCTWVMKSFIGIPHTCLFCHIHLLSVQLDAKTSSNVAVTWGIRDIFSRVCYFMGRSCNNQEVTWAYNHIPHLRPSYRHYSRFRQCATFCRNLKQSPLWRPDVFHLGRYYQWQIQFKNYKLYDIWPCNFKPIKHGWD